jgi:hypothetical protein
MIRRSYLTCANDQHACGCLIVHVDDKLTRRNSTRVHTIAAHLRMQEQQSSQTFVSQHMSFLGTTCIQAICRSGQAFQLPCLLVEDID